MGVKCPQLGTISLDYMVMWSNKWIYGRLEGTKKDIEAVARELGPMNDSPTMLIRLF